MQIPGLQSGQQFKLQVKPEELNDIMCKACNNKILVQLVMMKKIPALQSPSGKEMPLAIPAGVACFNCGKTEDIREVKPDGSVVPTKAKAGDGGKETGAV